LKELKVLNASKNYISSMPEPFHELSSLRAFNADMNLLETVPMFPKGIQRIDMLANRITVLPDDLKELADLKHIEVKGNPIQPASRAIMAALKENGVDTGLFFADVKKPDENPFDQE